MNALVKKFIQHLFHRVIANIRIKRIVSNIIDTIIIQFY